VEAGSDRAGFFKEVWRAAAGVVQEFRATVPSADEPAPPESPRSWYEQRPVPAKPARNAASPDDLSRLCGELGLLAHVTDVLEFARPSLRLTLSEKQRGKLGASRLGGAPDLPCGFEWPTWQGEELVFLGQISLEDVAAVNPTDLLPPHGLLLFFYDTVRQPSGLEPADRGSCRVVLHQGGPTSLEPALERDWFIEWPLELSLELTLPSSASFVVEQLNLDSSEYASWEELRKRLARLQDVELEEFAPEPYALHRLLGYPEGLQTRIELDCELASQGMELSDGAAYVDPQAGKLPPGVPEWRLLLQLSTDDEVGFYWGDGLGRLYIWIRERDLLERKTAEAWAILR
jgi:uncharacterized protein YwqG